MGSQSFDTEDGDIIKVIQDAVKTETIKVEKDEFLTRPVHLAPDKPFTKTFTLASLTGIADYVKQQIDAGAIASPVIRVVSPTEVRLTSQVSDREDRRFCPVSAEADVPKITVIGNYVAQELAMIELQSLFVQEGRVIEVLKDVGGIVLEEELGLDDDGVTQEVQWRSGIDRKTEKIENPVALKPFRTFTEIEQPESPFVLRLKKQDNNKLFVALFEADGGKWRNAARQSIKEKLAELLTEGNTVPILA